MEASFILKRREAARRADKSGSRSADAVGDRVAGGGGTDFLEGETERSAVKPSRKLGEPPILEAGAGGLAQSEFCESLYYLPTADA